MTTKPFQLCVIGGNGFVGMSRLVSLTFRHPQLT